MEHLIERSILLATDGTLDDVYIPQNTDVEKKEQAYLLNRSLEEVERSYIIGTLKRCPGKISGDGPPCTLPLVILFSETFRAFTKYSEKRSPRPCLCN